jgi:hypothetical protein
MAKLADAADLKSAGAKALWGFDSPSRHQAKEIAREECSGFRLRASVLTWFGLTPGKRLNYQTRQTWADGLTMGWPGLQEKASANSGMFTTTPLMR